MDYIKPGRSGAIHVGDVNLMMTYYDIQADRQYSKEISVPFRAVYEY